ncbi:hypothetical protein LOTGIDRAFT_221179 [Lottia gigantea]|uniref:Uncharacterized protein n=1 Tax=Lottia gigantea TaxID=225164 RepID=V3Z4X9_LOTGI|nr:hypothetical protein LOTGIDRAFT_221179 [Lottia gigantea]ESO85758.1 hypothetical protein LOTGIDRAFT_221179 [Lottia gigantea]
MEELNLKFVSQKISKIKWQPVPKQSLKVADTFVTGSWDDDVNKICLWKVNSGVQDENLQRDLEPQKICEAAIEGDVTDLCYVAEDQLMVTSSTGSVCMFKHNNHTGLEFCSIWKGLHEMQGESVSCTCIGNRGDDMVATSGEDGRLIILNINQTKPVRIQDNADSCTINSLTFLTQSEILTVNSFGQLKIFDIRRDSDQPVNIFSVNEDNTPLHCVDKHPGQPHIVAAGGQDGMLTIWDIRKDKYPMTLLEAHSAAMWEVKFHPSNPDHLFTCSEDGSLWHWDGSAMNILTNLVAFCWVERMYTIAPMSESSPWISVESSRHKLEINSLLPNKSLPVNSLDIQDSILLCGTDSETIYTVPVPNLC